MSQDEVVKSAADVAEQLIAKAVAWLDGRYGEGFSAKNPKLVEIYVNACIGWANALAVVRK